MIDKCPTCNNFFNIEIETIDESYFGEIRYRPGDITKTCVKCGLIIEYDHINKTERILNGRDN